MRFSECSLGEIASPQKAVNSAIHLTLLRPRLNQDMAAE